jgi:hypothetical protein
MGLKVITMRSPAMVSPLTKFHPYLSASSKVMRGGYIDGQTERLVI